MPSLNYGLESRDGRRNATNDVELLLIYICLVRAPFYAYERIIDDKSDFPRRPESKIATDAT